MKRRSRPRRHFGGEYLAAIRALDLNQLGLVGLNLQLGLALGTVGPNCSLHITSL